MEIPSRTFISHHPRMSGWHRLGASLPEPDPDLDPDPDPEHLRREQISCQRRPRCARFVATPLSLDTDPKAATRTTKHPSLTVIHPHTDLTGQFPATLRNDGRILKALLDEYEAATGQKPGGLEPPCGSPCLGSMLHHQPRSEDWFEHKMFPSSPIWPMRERITGGRIQIEPCEANC